MAFLSFPGDPHWPGAWGAWLPVPLAAVDCSRAAGHDLDAGSFAAGAAAATLEVGVGTRASGGRWALHPREGISSSEGE